MKINITRKLLLFASLILMVVGLIDYSVYISNQKMIESVQWFNHTKQVIYRTEKELSDFKHKGLEARDYVITSDSDYLSTLTITDKPFFSDFNELKQQTQDHSLQKTRIDLLNFYIQKRLNFSLQMIEFRSKRGLASAITYISAIQ